MDNCIFNIRIIYWHIKLERDKWLPRISYNSYHKENKLAYGWFDVCTWMGESR
jgi:hypothetical protein